MSEPSWMKYQRDHIERTLAGRIKDYEDKVEKWNELYPDEKPTYVHPNILYKDILS